MKPTELFKHLDETIDTGATPPILEDGPLPKFDDKIIHGAYDNDNAIMAPPKVMEADEPEQRPRIFFLTWETEKLIMITQSLPSSFILLVKLATLS